MLVKRARDNDKVPRELARRIFVSLLRIVPRSGRMIANSPPANESDVRFDAASLEARVEFSARVRFRILQTSMLLIAGARCSN
jgi:hypothetical protein